jgi:HSP20 family protein
MNIIPRDSFRELDKFFGDDDWFFPVFPSRKAFEPEMDVYETKKDVVAKISLPEIDCDDVSVSVEDGVLVISGDFKKESEDKDKERNYWRKEIRKGSFKRAIRLPAEVDENKTQADYENGVLVVTLPKVKPEKKRRREIKVKIKK